MENNTTEKGFGMPRILYMLAGCIVIAGAILAFSTGFQISNYNEAASYDQPTESLWLAVVPFLKAVALAIFTMAAGKALELLNGIRMNTEERR